MSKERRAWPLGITVVSEQFNSLEDELFDALTGRGFVSTDIINDFLRHKFQKENVVVERRSFMRYLSVDSRFVFDGPMRSRTVKAADLEKLERTSGWLEISDHIINYMLSLTVKEGVGVTTNKEDICQYFQDMRGDRFLHHSEFALDYAITQLMWGRRIMAVEIPEASQWLEEKELDLEDFVGLEFGWAQGAFVGYSGNGKKSGGLHLSTRSWETAKEISKELNAIHKHVLWDNPQTTWGIRDGDKTEMEVLKVFEEKTQNPILALALWKGDLTASDVVDTAIEVLRSQYSLEIFGL
ncbi:MAG: hypothetical protein DWC06_02745 [Candidatus Poseidoniales archaeon]|nr:MAG: hypothetical protein DWC06_02745 [Candidatus Poseidoniales archaeon]